MQISIINSEVNERDIILSTIRIRKIINSVKVTTICNGRTENVIEISNTY